MVIVNGQVNRPACSALTMSQYYCRYPRSVSSATTTIMSTQQQQQQQPQPCTLPVRSIYHLVSVCLSVSVSVCLSLVCAIFFGGG